jgi:hypothetical protein
MTWDVIVIGAGHAGIEAAEPIFTGEEENGKTDGHAGGDEIGARPRVVSSLPKNMFFPSLSPLLL